MNNFTKGPWTLIGLQGIAIWSGDEMIASTNGPRENHQQKRANAQLIAAAPELYEALEAILGKAYKQNWNDAYPVHVEKAEAALAKARGES